ncbi:MAG TPA: hypothetical protein VFV80_01540 [Geminicoccaceae bacterium]|nr:hypothetical protein [Geminicoccaceae bacterium]
MNIDLTAALARSLPEPPPPTGTGRRVPHGGPKALTAGIAAKPVLQLSDVPLPLDPADYRNPYSNTNPQGDQRTLYAFRSLVDPVPEFDRAYRPSARSTERVYQNLVRGASAKTGQDFAAAVLADARQSFDESALENLVITPGKWHPVYATPSDWYDPAQTGRFQPIELDLADDGSGAFTLLPGSDRLQWRLGDPSRPQLTKPPDPDTRPNSLRFRCLQVTLQRPWLDFEIFGLQGWYLQGQAEGYYSTGEATTNPGVLPLVPTRILLGTDIELDARIGPGDRDLVRQATAGGLPLALGPFDLGSIALAGDGIRAVPAGRPALYVVGWCSDLVPLAPAIAGNR